MKIEQKVNLPAIQETNLNSTSSSQSERSNAISRQKDAFETAIETRKESALFKQEKAVNDYNVTNVEGTIGAIPVLGMTSGTVPKTAESDQAPIKTDSLSEQAQDAEEKKSKSKEAEKQTSSDQRNLLEDLRLMNAKIKA